MNSSENDHVDLPEFDSQESRGGLLVGRLGHVAVVLFDRPEQENAFDMAMLNELPKVWLELDADDNVRAIVMGSTTKRVFCPGIDVRELGTDDGIMGPAGRSAQDAPIGRSNGGLTTRNVDMYKPVICAVEGLVRAGGLHFVGDADIVVASKNATFQDSHTSIGFVGALENIALAAKVGIGAALYLTLVGQDVALDADRAQALGLVQEVVEPGQALDRALSLAASIAKNSPSATKASNEALWALPMRGYHESLELGWALMRRQWMHPDSVEGPLAFTEGREPQWTAGPLSPPAPPKRDA